jgi:hypothetical protein
MDLQETIEQFLSDTERRRSEVTVRRYGEAMELLQSHLALERLDPESPGDSSPGLVDDVTPEALESFIDEFLADRLHAGDRARKRYIAAMRSFVQWLTRSKLVSSSRGESLLEVLRQRARTGSPGEGSAAGKAPERMAEEGADRDLEPDGEGESSDGAKGPLQLLSSRFQELGIPIELDGERYFEVLEVRSKTLVLLDVQTADEVRGDRPPDEPVEPGELVAGSLGTKGGRPWVTSIRLLTEEELEGDDLLFDWDDDLFDDDDLSDDDEPLVEDALEILASEDRYAPREVVRVILGSFDEVRDTLLEWLTDDEYRNDPFEGAGEAPANAARLLSEMQEPEAVARLIDALGDGDPLGEEAPPALGRYGAAVLEPVSEELRNRDRPLPRRGAAVWALAHLATRNPALRGPVSERLVGELPEGPAPLVEEILDALEELRAAEVLDKVRDLARAGSLDLEAHERTLELLQGRITNDGWGERLAESLLPVAYLYPTNDELEEFYESLEEDLGDLWDLMTMDEDDHEDDGGGGEGNHDDPGTGGGSGKGGDSGGSGRGRGAGSDRSRGQGRGSRAGQDAESPRSGGKVLPFRKPRD